MSTRKIKNRKKILQDNVRSKDFSRGDERERLQWRHGDAIEGWLMGDGFGKTRGSWSCDEEHFFF